MKKQFNYFLIAIFAIFFGSQITEGILIVPYWQSLPTSDFYSYYAEFGPAIGHFYTILTIIALLVPMALAVVNFRSKTFHLFFSIASIIFAILFVSCFYVYFKGTNELFYQSAFSAIELKSELIIWSNWHWGRVGLESLSLVFSILAITKRDQSYRY